MARAMAHPVAYPMAYPMAHPKFLILPVIKKNITFYLCRDQALERENLFSAWSVKNMDCGLRTTD